MSEEKLEVSKEFVLKLERFFREEGPQHFSTPVHAAANIVDFGIMSLLTCGEKPDQEFFKDVRVLVDKILEVRIQFMTNKNRWGDNGQD